MSSPIDRLKKIFVWIIIGRCQFLFCVLIDLIFLIFWKTLRVKEHGGRKQAGNPRLVTTDYNHAAGDILKRIIVFGNRIFHPFPPWGNQRVSLIIFIYIGFFSFFSFSFPFFLFCIDWRGASRPSKGGAWGHCTLLAPQARGVDKRGEKEGSYAVVKAHALILATFQTLFWTMLRSFFPLSLSLFFSIIFFFIFWNP